MWWKRASENVYACICAFAPFLMGGQLLRFRPGRHSQDLAGLHPEPRLHVLTTVQHAWVKDGETTTGRWGMEATERGGCWAKEAPWSVQWCGIMSLFTFWAVVMLNRQGCVLGGERTWCQTIVGWGLHLSTVCISSWGVGEGVLMDMEQR